MYNSPTILKAFDKFDEDAQVGSFYHGPVNSSTIYAPPSIIHYCDNGDMWLGKGWYARRKPVGKCQVRITAHDGKLSVFMPRWLFGGLRYSHCLNVNDTWKIDNFQFIKEW